MKLREWERDNRRTSFQGLLDTVMLGELSDRDSLFVDKMQGAYDKWGSDMYISEEQLNYLGYLAQIESSMDVE